MVNVESLSRYLATIPMATGSLSPSEYRSQFFSKKWTITIPSNPSVKFFRATPSHFDIWLPIATNADNNKLQDNKDQIWDEAAISKLKIDMYNQYVKSNTDFHCLKVLVEVSGEVIGFGDIFVVEPGVANIGVVLNKEARGKGLGRLTVGFLTQLTLDFGLSVVAGTMGDNAPMRFTLRSLGFAEEEKIIEIFGRGVVAEFSYSLLRDAWEEVEMNVEFGEGE
ncbi:08b91d98-47ae-4ab7-aa54-0f4ee9dcb1f4-CDS [Sclerotinia trifoliorum]|uniref:08b91d98-47ae-4ab7-aa54-0f4ee9dcb1f4-CDS n=1 Tax=Sclerotinia trifoliorum TaxID=28548 RepID=A0A8H2ZW74_9HELO|nr:08b91d98-47ae-4ab7-aa54-0f4ee9dcb1f4-CDS [Sclerotinia trifoliorum]